MNLNLNLSSIDLVSYAASIVIGIVIGYWLGIRERRRLDKLHPEDAPHYHGVSKTPIMQRIIAGSLALLGVFTVIQASVQAQRQTDEAERARTIAENQAACNQQFIMALKSLLKIGGEERENTTRVISGFGAALAGPETTRDATLQQIFGEYSQRVRELEQKRAANAYPVDVQCEN